VKGDKRLIFVLFLLAVIILLPIVACDGGGGSNDFPTPPIHRPNKWDMPYVRQQNPDGSSDYTWQGGEGDTCRTTEENGVVLSLDCTK